MKVLCFRVILILGLHKEISLFQGDLVPFVSESWDGSASDNEVFKARSETLIKEFEASEWSRYLHYIRGERMVLFFGLILPIICAIISAVSGAWTVRRLFREKNPDLLSLVGLILTLFFGIMALVLPMQSLAFQHGQLIEQHNRIIDLLQEILKNP